MGFQKVARLAELSSTKALGIRVEGIDVGLYSVGDAVFAMEDRCPHADALLSEGHLEGTVIECPVHGWRFDVTTGFRPEDADGFPIPCFAVRIEGDDVYVDLEHCINRRLRSARRG